MKKDIVKIKPCKKVDTFDAERNPNGWLLELVSEVDSFTKHLKGQMYLSVAEPGTFKGFHLHAISTYYVICIKGRVQEIIYKDRKTKQIVEMGDDDFKTVELPKGYPHAIHNIGSEQAYVLIYRYPGWDPNVKEQLDISPDEIETKKAWREIKKFIKKWK